MKIIKKKLIMLLVLAMIFCMMSITSMAVTSENSQEMTEEELTTFTKMLNEIENNGFTQSTYSKASEINLNMAFRNCGSEEIGEEEKQDLLELLKVESFEIPVYKLTEEQVMNSYETKTGEKITDSDIKQRLSWTYSEKYNAYYTMHGDTSFYEVKCISGEKDLNGIYRIVYQAMDDKGKLYTLENGKNDLTTDIDKMIVTIQKNGNNYIFVSNEIYKETNSENNTLINQETDQDNTITKKSSLPKAGKNGSMLLIIIIAGIVFIFTFIKIIKYKK